MSTEICVAPMRSALRRPATVSTTIFSLPVSSITSQATQRVALPQASALEPSLFQMRMKTSPARVDSMAITWSAPAPVSGLAMALICSGLRPSTPFLSSKMTKEFPAPFIFQNFMGGDVRGLGLGEKSGGKPSPPCGERVG